MNPWIRASVVLVLLMISGTFLASCGGGGGSSAPPGRSSLSITTDAILPGTLQGRQYSAMLSAANGVGPLQWSITRISSTALFVDGLTINPSTGVVSGTVGFGGTAGFIAQVTDSASPPRTATKTFFITASMPLQPPPAQTLDIMQYGDLVLPIFPSIEGGVAPLTFSVTSGSLPPGLRLDRNSGLISGSATTCGVYLSTLTIQDSYSPPEVVTTQVTINVVPPALQVANSLPTSLLLNRSFSGRVIARGGIPPYSFSVASGTVPPGLSSVDPSSGHISGTPTTLGSYFFTVNVSDSGPLPQQSSWLFGIAVVQSLGRNDTPATATPISNGMFNATISPYIDPPNGPPVAGDNDYYKLVSLGGSTVHVETQAKRNNQDDPLDTVLEVVDGNGVRFDTCRQPGDTGTNFTSPCINDDIGSGIQDSALDFGVPGPASGATNFYVHVLDWRGDARPDMNYALQVSGAAPPHSIQSTPLLPAARGLSYFQQLSSSNGTGAVSWSVVAGSLPPGLALSTAGAITGAAATNGTYAFTVQASDASSPPQVATALATIQVVEPVNIVSSSTFPDACVNQPYSFAIQTSGGLPPFSWGFISSAWVAINLNQSTGVFSGTTNVTGTFTGALSVADATTHGVLQQVTLTVKQCP